MFRNMCCNSVSNISGRGLFVFRFRFDCIAPGLIARCVGNVSLRCNIANYGDECLAASVQHVTNFFSY